MLARSCCSYNIKELSPPKKQLLHTIHKTAQMTDTQQKPIHYKITQIYTNIKKKKNKYSLKQNIQYKIWQVLGYIQSLARFGMAACQAGACGFLMCGFYQQCSVASISQGLLVVGHDGFTHKFCHCTTNGGCCLQHFILFYSTFGQGVHCKSINWSVTAA